VKVVLAGGSGTLGRRIADHLRAKEHDIVVLTRNHATQGRDRYAVWDGSSVGAWADELNGAAVINLAGLLVDRRPTAKNINLLTRSRVEPTRALVHAAARIVFDRDTPALNRLSGLVRWGLGGRVGSGRQWVSWLHIDDFLAVVCLALDDPSMSGIVHATSPEPVRNAELMATRRSVLHRPWSPPTPSALVHAGAPVLRTDPALALSGRRCIPARLSERNFHFEHPTLKPALADLLGDHTRSV
jgi:NAD dependent epimerase/dehydratase family enzyme